MSFYLKHKINKNSSDLNRFVSVKNNKNDNCSKNIKTNIIDLDETISAENSKSNVKTHYINFK